MNKRNKLKGPSSNWKKYTFAERFLQKPVKCIVPVSGGKDSQACLKMAIEEFGAENVLGLFCDTKFEHPLTYEHVNKMQSMYGDTYIIHLSAGDVISKCVQRGRFPGGGARHCTNELKIIPTKKFLKSYGRRFGAVQVWYGMRVDESSERAKRYEYKDPDDLHLPHEVISNYPKYLAGYGIRYRLPIVDWYTEEVFDYIGEDKNPLYDQGFQRVGCFPCLAGGDKAKIKAFKHDKFGAQQLIDIRVVEEKLGKSVFTSGIGKAFDAGCIIEQDQIDFIDDNSQGCRVCEI